MPCRDQLARFSMHAAQPNRGARALQSRRSSDTESSTATTRASVQIGSLIMAALFKATGLFADDPTPVEIAIRKSEAEWGQVCCQHALL